MVRVRTSDKICCDLNLSENSAIKVTSLDITKAIENGELPIVVVNRHNENANAHSQIITGINSRISQKANISDVPTKVSDLIDDTATNPIDKADTLTGLTATVTELNYTDGVTSNIQTQLNGKLSLSTKYGADLSYSNSSLQLKDQDGNALGNAVTIESSPAIDETTITKNSNDELQAVKLVGLTSSIAQLNYCSSVTSDIQTQLNNKANTDLDNLSTTGEAKFTAKASIDAANFSTTGKSTLSGLSMPSSRYTDLTLGATGSTYTAPANGYYYLAKDTNATAQRVKFINTTCGDISVSSWSSNSQNIDALIPVNKGDNVQVIYTAGGAIHYFRFIYAQGEQ